MAQTASSPPFAERAKRLREWVDAALVGHLAPVEGLPEDLRAAIRHSLLAPGKRLRPMLLLLACEACGGEAEAALPAACAVEMVHTYSLVHDDLPAMDDDDLRRGRPTCHKAFGEALAILAGDALLTLAFEVLTTEIHPPAVAARCCANLAQAAGMCGMVGGQADDLAAERGTRTAADLESLESIHARKTGAMIAASLRLGGLVAEAPPTQLAALETYGQCLGVAFQIIDDLLDVEGDERSLGKRAHKDAGRGKLTFPELLGAEASRRRAEELIRQARDALAPLGPRADALKALADYVLQRDR